MPTKIAINGFGRIGRAALRIALKNSKLQVVAINDLGDGATMAYLLEHDSVYGRYGQKIGFKKDHWSVNGKKILYFQEKEPNKLPWGKLKIDVVLECTGFFTSEAGSKLHLDAGAKRVIISAPAKGGNVPTFVKGVNDDKYNKATRIINNASCTTNCLTPVVEVIERNFGIKKALMSTIHSYTSTQSLLDAPHKDLDRARAAAINIIPTTTGAAIATTQVIPELTGLFDGLSFRVPTPVGSLCDCTFVLKKIVTVDDINNALRKAAASSRYKGVLAVSEHQLVSTDIIGNPYSSIVDLSLTKVIDGDFVKIISWYDNEWGYANRLVEMALVINKF